MTITRKDIENHLWEVGGWTHPQAEQLVDVFFSRSAKRCSALRRTRFSFALDIMAHYDESFIKTGKDKRKAMFRDFQGAYREAQDECLSRSEGHEFLIKELTSAQRALKKVLKEL